MGVPPLMPPPALPLVKPQAVWARPVPRAEILRLWVVDAVKLFGGLGFLAQIDCFRGVSLHAVSQLVAADAGSKVRVVGAGRLVLAIIIAESIEETPLHRVGHAGGP